MSTVRNKTASIERLLAIMAHLRDPNGGCPWDQAQDFRSVAPYTLEEAYEVVDAIESGVPAALEEELGDLLFQVVFHAQLASEAGWFDFGNVTAAICDKLTRRHPHVFADAVVEDAQAQTLEWEKHKQRERGEQRGTLEGVPLSLPALTRADKLQRKAAAVGFDWPDVSGVYGKIEEELSEVSEELQGSIDRDALLDECGDLLFAVVNLLRHANIDPETALRHGNAKFVRRFEEVERLCALDGISLTSADLDTLERYWEQAKSNLNAR